MYGLSNFEEKHIHEHAKNVCYRKIKSVILLNRIQKSIEDNPIPSYTDLDYNLDIKELNYYNKNTNKDLRLILSETKREIECDLVKIIQNYKTARYAFVATQLNNVSYDLQRFCECYFGGKGDVESLIKEQI